MTAARGGPRADSPARRTAARRGVPTLAAHLDATYEIEVTGLDQLDLGVYRVDRSDGPSWVVRVFPAIRPRALGWWLGALHALGPDTTTGAMVRPGGAWHHLADGSPRDEAGALATLVDEAGATLSGRERTRYDAVRAAVEELDTGDGLPTAFTHPDFVMANVVAPGDGTMVLIDWSGAGQAPRACALGFLLWSVGFGGDLARVDRAVDGYRRRVQPEPEELARLDTLVASRPIVFEAWAFATGGAGAPTLSETARYRSSSRPRASIGSSVCAASSRPGSGSG